jgi:hypothetical protein
MDIIVKQTYTCIREITTTSEPEVIIEGTHEIYESLGTIKDVTISGNLARQNSWDRVYKLTMVIEVHMENLIHFAQAIQDDWQTIPELPKVEPVIYQ